MELYTAGETVGPSQDSSGVVYLIGREMGYGYFNFFQLFRWLFFTWAEPVRCTCRQWKVCPKCIEMAKSRELAMGDEHIHSVYSVASARLERSEDEMKVGTSGKE